MQERFIVRLNALAPEERTRLLDSLRTIADLMDATDSDAAPLLLPGTEAEPLGVGEV